LAQSTIARLDELINKAAKYQGITDMARRVSQNFINNIGSKGLLEKGGRECPMKFHGCRHCEAMLGALISAGVEDESVKAMASNEVLKIIAVSFPHPAFP